MTSQRSKVKIFGERNTSTNAMASLLRQNAEVRVLPSTYRALPKSLTERLRGQIARWRGKAALEAEIDRIFASRPPALDWKHSAPLFHDVSSLDDTLVLIMVRNPYSWLRSLHRRPHNAAGPVDPDFTAFLTQAWPTLGRDRLDGATTTPIRLYQAKLDAYLKLEAQLTARNTAVRRIRFEDFATDQLAVFAGFADLLTGAAQTPRPVTGGIKDKDKTARDYAAYYSQELWKADYPDSARQIVTDGLDWALMARFGYAPWTTVGA